MLIPENWQALVLMSAYFFTMLNQWFTFVRLSNPYMPGSTPAFNRNVHHRNLSDWSSLRLFEACSYKPASKDLPSSRIQHRATYARSWHKPMVKVTELKVSRKKRGRRCGIFLIQAMEFLWPITLKFCFTLRQQTLCFNSIIVILSDSHIGLSPTSHQICLK